MHTYTYIYIYICNINIYIYIYIHTHTYYKELIIMMLVDDGVHLEVGTGALGGCALIRGELY